MIPTFIRIQTLLLIVSTLFSNVIDVDNGRKNAITRSIQTVGPAVASINVIKQRTTPFFNDPFFHFFSLKNHIVSEFQVLDLVW